MKRRIILLGPPAAGKGTQAQLIFNAYKIPSVSPGAILREQKNAGSALGLEADELTREGRFVPDEIILGLVNSWLKQNAGSCVFDGVPRTLKQAQLLDELLIKNPIQLAIHLDADEQTIRHRVARRRVCGKCSKVYSLGLDLSAGQETCTVCRGGIEVRPDDSPEALCARLREYVEKSFPLISFYERKKLLVRVDANRSAEEVFTDVAEFLKAP